MKSMNLFEEISVARHFLPALFEHIKELIRINYDQGVLDGQELYLPTFDENDEINGIQQISHYHS